MPITIGNCKTNTKNQQQAAQAAIFNFFDTLRVELGSSVGGITIVTPGWIESEMTMGKFLDRSGKMDVDEAQRDVRKKIHTGFKSRSS
jgi:NAD(P)-dependent dehydrogenase (short-subunit alcohol dehydrogenase family)